ncbi:MAG TPA: tripartite tricarboxylate transporter permease [Kiritimatiellia bacterium]|nr:tripartite tricarboxylate transporter permease [Kiritimatiellia bacterium]
MDALMVLTAALVGTALSCLISVLPALHAYNILGALAVSVYWMEAHGINLPPQIFLPLMAGVIVGWSMLNTIPSILLGAPDESAMFTVLPGQKYLMSGRGFEGTMITGVGGLAGVFFLVFVVGPFAPRFLPVVQSVLRPHMHWILWVIITYILMSEWPKGGNWGPAGLAKFLDAWRSLGAGLATFFLSAFLGFILLYRSPVAVEMAFQNIMPAFVGLFAVPWCLVNLISAARIPPQRMTDSLEINGDLVLRSVGAGGLGGGFAAFFPVITGGIGGLLAGHATAQRNEKVFIMSQGVSKLVYYVGSFMLLFVPGLGLTRGGAAWMMKSVYVPRTSYDYFMILAAIAISGGVSFLLMGPLTRWTIRFIEKVNYRNASSLALGIILVLVWLMTGWGGMAVMLISTGIGLIPVLFGSRRLNCLGVLLLPIACNMSGFGQQVAHWLGLI